MTFKGFTTLELWWEHTVCGGGSSRLAVGGKEGGDALLLVDPDANDGAQLAGKMLIAQHADTW